MSLQAKFHLATALVAILVIGLAAFAVHAVSATSDLIVRLYDQPLMGVNYARAAATTLADARGLIERSQSSDPAASLAAMTSLRQTERDIADDLRIVRDRVNDPSVMNALEHVEAAVQDWLGQ